MAVGGTPDRHIKTDDKAPAVTRGDIKVAMWTERYNKVVGKTLYHGI